MTDYEKLKNLLTEFGVKFKECSDEKYVNIVCAYPYVMKNSKISGYTGFYTKFIFNFHGKFIEMGAWE